MLNTVSRSSRHRLYTCDDIILKFFFSFFLDGQRRRLKNENLIYFFRCTKPDMLVICHLKCIQSSQHVTALFFIRKQVRILCSFVYQSVCSICRLSMHTPAEYFIFFENENVACHIVCTVSWSLPLENE